MKENALEMTVRAFSWILAQAYLKPQIYYEILKRNYESLFQFLCTHLDAYLPIIDFYVLIVFINLSK